MTARKHEQFQWTDDNIQRLHKLWNGPAKAREIATILGTTRMSVIGKANRMKLRSRKDMRLKDPAPKYKPRPARKTKYEKDREKRQEINSTAYGDGGPKSLLDLRRKECCWPVGDIGFCGAPIAKKSYCENHASIAYRK